MKKILFRTLFLISLILAITLGIKSSFANKRDGQETQANAFIGKDAYKDKFQVADKDALSKPTTEISSVLGETDDPSLKFNKHLVEIPLVRPDYYYGKHINATAAVAEINQTAPLTPGESISLINDGFLTMSSARGYISPGTGFLHASGVCWSTSTLGLMMDEANKNFENKYGLDLFVFQPGDRLPHPAKYATYADSNDGWGYAVVKSYKGGKDFTFTINPEIENNSRLKNLKVEVVMISREDNKEAFLGQSIGAYLRTNVDF